MKEAKERKKRIEKHENNLIKNMEADGIRSLTYGSNGSIYRIVQSRGRHKVSVKDSAAYLSPALILDSPNLKCR